MNDDYRKALKRGMRTYNRSLARGEDPYLPALDEIVNTNGLSTTYLGIVEVPGDLFAGTKTRGRQNSFARDYMPIMKEDTEFAYKWSNLYMAQVNEGIRDPVKCYEYLGRFYVEEGNKRVSVLKYLDVPAVVCDVTRIMPMVEDPLYEEFLEFYKVAPTYVFDFTVPGSYRKFASYLNRDLKERWMRDDLNRILAGYYRFASVFKERTGDTFKGHIGDAYLVYLSFYSPESLIDYPKSMLKSRVRDIMPEFLAVIEKGKQKLLEDPSQDVREKHAYETVLDLLSGRIYTTEKPLQAAFFYRGDPEKSAWLYGHEEGRKIVQDLYGGILKTRAYADYGDDEAFSLKLDEAVKDGADVVFTCSAEDIKETLRASLRHPDVLFYNCSLNEPHREVATYYIKMYAVKSILGALAAIYAKDHKIGYVAHYPVYGTIANINAFAIGAAMIDPEVKIYLEWDTSENSDWRKSFYEKGISVISAHDDSGPDRKDEERGLYCYNENSERIQLAEPVCNWGRYYELILENILNGKNYRDDEYALNYWYGMSAGVVDIRLSDDLPYYTVKLIDTLKDGVINNMIDPFEKKIVSQEKEIQDMYMTRLANEEIINMDWLNDNIVGSLPKQSELSDGAKKLVAVSGVEKVRKS